MRKQQLIPIVIIGFIALAIVAIRAAGAIWPFRIISDQVSNPAGVAINGLRNNLADKYKFFSSITSLNTENKQLRVQELELRQQLSSLKEVSRDNEILRSQLNFNSRLNFSLVPARVVSLDPDNSRRFITIDRGSSSGIKTGQAVVSSGVLIGTVDEINDYSSKIFLVSDPEFRIRAVGQDGRAQGIIRGQIGQGYIFEKIAQGETISQGEQVVTAGSGQVPQGVLLGTVETVNRSDNSIFQSANVKPLIDLNNLELVFIITGLKQ
ncbi:MAG: rod shape-determining protein MreC [Patescibacteria group bacterium]|nr:rod shape-determining protein MreC [Patescibacteria group bacterium]